MNEPTVIIKEISGFKKYVLPQLEIDKKWYIDKISSYADNIIPLDKMKQSVDS